MSRQVWVGMAIVLLLLAMLTLACESARVNVEKTVVVVEGVTQVVEKAVEKEPIKVVELPESKPERVTLWSWAYNDFEVWALETLSERASDAQQLEVELTYVR